jgi:hypothetical protein
LAGYSFDLIFQEVLEVNLLGSLDNLDLTDKIEALILTTVMYTRMQKAGLKNLSPKGDFVGALAASALGSLTHPELSFESIDMRYITALETLLNWSTIEFGLDGKMVEMLGEFKATNQFMLEYLGNEQNKEIILAKDDELLREDSDIKFLSSRRLFAVVEEVVAAIDPQKGRGGLELGGRQGEKILERSFGFEMAYFRQLWRQRRQHEVAGSEAAVRKENK